MLALGTSVYELRGKYTVFEWPAHHALGLDLVGESGKFACMLQSLQKVCWSGASSLKQHDQIILRVVTPARQMPCLYFDAASMALLTRWDRLTLSFYPRMKEGVHDVEHACGL